MLPATSPTRSPSDGEQPGRQRAVDASAIARALSHRHAGLPLKSYTQKLLWMHVRRRAAYLPG